MIASGQVDRARAPFEQVLGYCNDLGLMSEQTDAATGEMVGNFPQAFSHMGIINTAIQLEKAERLEAQS